MPLLDFTPLLELLLTCLSLFAMGWWPCGGCGCECDCCTDLAPDAYQVEFSGVTKGFHDCSDCDALNSTFELPRSADSCCAWELSGDVNEGVFPCDDPTESSIGKFLCKIDFNLFCSDDSEVYVISSLIVYNCIEYGFINTESGWSMFHNEYPIDCDEFTYTLRNVASEQALCDWDSVQVTLSSI